MLSTIASDIYGTVFLSLYYQAYETQRIRVSSEIQSRLMNEIWKFDAKTDDAHKIAATHNWLTFFSRGTHREATKDNHIP